MTMKKSIVREVAIFPAHLIWVAWRVVGINDKSTLVQIWKSTNDEFWTEVHRGGRFLFAIIGSLGIYVLIVHRIIRSCIL